MAKTHCTVGSSTYLPHLHLSALPMGLRHLSVGLQPTAASGATRKQGKSRCAMSGAAQAQGVLEVLLGLLLGLARPCHMMSDSFCTQAMV